MENKVKIINKLILSLNNIKIFLRSNYLIILVLLLAFILRFWGINYGLPGLFVGDEKSIVSGSMKMISQKNIFPVFSPDIFRSLYYPVLIPWILLLFFIPWLGLVYLFGDFSSLSQMSDYFILRPESLFLIGRFINVLFSVASVFLIYKVTYRLFSKRAGLLAAILYAVSWLPIHQAHFIKHWNIGGFFALLVLYFSINILKNPSWRNYILTGVFIGLAACADYIHIIYSLFITFFHFLFLKLPFRDKILSRKFWLCVLVSILLFIVGIVTYPQEFHRIALGEDSTVSAVKNLQGFFQVSSEIFFTLYYFETILFILSIIGALILFFSDKKIFLALLFIPILSPFIYYFLLHFEARYVLLFLPILAILSGFALDKVFVFLKIKSYTVLIILLFLIILLPLRNAVIFDTKLSNEDTRILAKKWIESNIPYDSKIIINSWEFNLDRNSKCIYDQQKINSSSLRSRDYVMLDMDKKDAYCVWPIDLVLTNPENINEYQYYVVDDYTTKRLGYLSEDVISKAELIIEFKGSNYDIIENLPSNFIHQLLIGNLVGPNVKIYKLNTIN